MSDWRWASVPLIVLGSIMLVVSVGLLVLTIHVAFFMSGSAISTAHPSSARVVEKYLTALSTGDARTAESLDGEVLTKVPYRTADRTTLLTDDALSSATSRISHASSVVEIASSSSAIVDSKWMFSGKHYSRSFSLRWDKASAKWVLEDSLANVVSIKSYLPDSDAAANPGLRAEGCDAAADFARAPAGAAQRVPDDRGRLFLESAELAEASNSSFLELSAKMVR